MKVCPFCANEINDAATKCQYCHEFLSGPKPSASITLAQSEAAAAMQVATSKTSKKGRLDPMAGLRGIYVVLGIIVAVALAVSAFSEGALVAGILSLVAAGIMFFAIPLGWSVGDALRRFVMPDSYFVVGGFSALLKQKIFWMIGPQTVGSLVAAAILLVAPSAMFLSHREAVETGRPYTPPSSGSPVNLVASGANSSVSAEPSTVETANTTGNQTAEAPSSSPAPIQSTSAAAETPSPAPTVTPPSFDCSRASVNAERMICANAALGALDSEMASSFRSLIAQSDPGHRSEFNEEQESWIEDTRDRCEDASCLVDAYRKRIADIHEDQRGGTG